MYRIFLRGVKGVFSAGRWAGGLIFCELEGARIAGEVVVAGRAACECGLGRRWGGGAHASGQSGDRMSSFL